jgi:hypothetical protein
MTSLLNLTEKGLTVKVISFKNEDSMRYEIHSIFAGQDIKSERTYYTASKALADARTIFHLLNGISELMEI